MKYTASRINICIHQHNHQPDQNKKKKYISSSPESFISPPVSLVTWFPQFQTSNWRKNLPHMISGHHDLLRWPWFPKSLPSSCYPPRGSVMVSLTSTRLSFCTEQALCLSMMKTANKFHHWVSSPYSRQALYFHLITLTSFNLHT